MPNEQTREQRLESALRDLMRHHRNSVASALSRIVEASGGDEDACDSVERMISGNPYLRKAEEALAYGASAFDPDRPHCPGCGDGSGWNDGVLCAFCNADGSRNDGVPVPHPETPTPSHADAESPARGGRTCGAEGCVGSIDRSAERVENEGLDRHVAAGVKVCPRCGAIEANGEAHGPACTRGVKEDQRG